MKDHENRFVSRLSTGILLLTLLTLFSGCAKKEAKEIKIGAILPLTGDVASYGVAIQQGIDLAVEQLNNNGGVQGKKIEVIYEDDEGDPKLGLSAARKLITIDRVEVIIGAVPSSVTLAIAPVVEKNKVVLLSPASSSPKITSAGDYIFRNYPSDELEGRLVAQFAYSNDYRSAALITANTDYGDGLRKIFKSEFLNLGGVIDIDEIYDEGENDFRTILSKIMVMNLDCIFIVGYGIELGKIVRQARELGIPQQFLSTVNFYDPQSLLSGGLATEGVIFTSPVFEPQTEDEPTHSFVKYFESRFNHKPDVWAAHGFDALNIIVKVMNEFGLSGNDIKNGLYSIEKYPGVSGLTTFDANGDVIKEAHFLTVRNGIFVKYVK